jgi:hypothetical protein
MSLFLRMFLCDIVVRMREDMAGNRNLKKQPECGHVALRMK